MWLLRSLGKNTLCTKSLFAFKHWTPEHSLILTTNQQITPPLQHIEPLQSRRMPFRECRSGILKVRMMPSHSPLGPIHPDRGTPYDKQHTALPTFTHPKSGWLALHMSIGTERTRRTTQSRYESHCRLLRAPLPHWPQPRGKQQRQ